MPGMLSPASFAPARYKYWPTTGDSPRARVESAPLGSAQIPNVLCRLYARLARIVPAVKDALDGGTGDVQAGQRGIVAARVDIKQVFG